MHHPTDPTVSVDDRLVWDTPADTVLIATRTLHMEGEEHLEPVFTKGRAYRVESMHPIARPPYVTVVDDQGCEHLLHGEHLRAWFARRPVIA